MIYGIKDDTVMCWENVIEAANDLDVRHTFVADAILRGLSIKGWEFKTDFSVQQ